MRTNPQPAAAPVSHHYPDCLSRESWVCSPRNGFRRHAWKCHLGVFPKRFVLTAAGREEATRLELALRCSRSPGKEARGAGERGGPWDEWAAASSRSGPDTGLQKLWTFTLLSRGSPSLGGGRLSSGLYCPEGQGEKAGAQSPKRGPGVSTPSLGVPLGPHLPPPSTAACFFDPHSRSTHRSVLPREEKWGKAPSTTKRRSRRRARPAPAERKRNPHALSKQLEWNSR